VLTYRIQVAAFGDLDKAVLRGLSGSQEEGPSSAGSHPFVLRIATTREGAKLNPGALLAREWNGRVERIMEISERIFHSPKYLRQTQSGNCSDSTGQEALSE
jgi:hypothetical protein